MSDVSGKRIKEILYLAAEFDDNMDTDLFKVISMSSICRIFDSKQLRDVIGGILSLYALMNRTLLEDEVFRDSLLNEGFQLNALKIRGKSDLSNYIKFVDPELNSKFLLYLDSENARNDYAPIRIRRVSNIFKERFSNLNFSIGFIVAFTGLCLCLMCKKLTKYNHFGWVRQKWKSFLGTVGLDHQFSECGPSYHLMPGLNTCSKLYTFFKQHREFRRRLYLGIMKLSWESGLWGNMCRAVLRFAKGLEINHIVLINTYILQDHPELTHVEELKSEFRKLQTAFRVFRKETIPEEQWPYIQIMNKVPSDIWSKKKFPILSYLSVQIGKRIRTNLEDYHCELSSEMQDIANRIMAEIINYDSASQIAQTPSENSLGNIAILSNMRNEEFPELFEMSDILEKSLYALNGVRNFNKDDEDLIFLPNAIPCSEIKYFKISENVDGELHKIVCLLNISRIYQNECLSEVIGGMLSLFAAVDPATWSEEEDCKKSLKTHGFELCEILIESANDLASHFVFENDELNELFLKFLNLTSTDISYSVTIKRNDSVCQMFRGLFLKTLAIPNIFAYIGMYLLPIFKQLDENNYDSWLRHKWVTFCRLTNKSVIVSFSNILLPSQSTCINIHSFFYSNFELRRALFLKSLNFLKLSDPIRFIFLVICQNAKESELTHIYLINYFILQQNKHLLKMKELKPELVRFMRAIESIRCMLPSVNFGWLYIKLISHPNEVEFLNKNHFPLLLYLSDTIRESENKPKYAGVAAVTEYFKKVEESRKNFSKFYNNAMTEKSIKKFFELKFPNGDLLSSLEYEQLKQLTINSLLFSTCHDETLGIIPDDKKKQIMDMSMEEVKEKYEHFNFSFRMMFSANSMIIQRIQKIVQGLNRRSTVEAVSEFGEADLQINSTESVLQSNPVQGELRNNLFEDALQIHPVEDELRNNLFEDALRIDPFEDELRNNLFEDALRIDAFEDELQNNLFEDALQIDPFEDELRSNLFEDALRIDPFEDELRNNLFEDALRIDPFEDEYEFQ
ncbi:uncharacterized protein [Parasteatoda tepidariorum]|uniref:uncharacterized protein isoform X1 n=1 Tax=Parasteatoda tepidariorum TaxID=114398 RepID=UPI001C722648|nr:uncharacterized protein LOC107438196 isoform X1 [Parasteatoda tepidariorum]